MSPPARLAVLLSGRGSNYVAIQEAVLRGALRASVELVVSDVESAPGLERARSFGVRVAAIPRLAGEDRSAHERRVIADIDEVRADWICLAGYMRILSPEFVRHYRERILNVHPSLLPAFPGRDAQRQALKHGVKVSGCTVHFVDEGVDSGPIVEQRVVPVLDDDSPEELALRILQEEHRAFPQALGRLVGEEWRVIGRRVVFGARDSVSGRPRDSVSGKP